MLMDWWVFYICSNAKLWLPWWINNQMCQLSVLKFTISDLSPIFIAASKAVVLMLQLPGYSLLIMNGLGYWPLARTKIWQSASSLYKSLQWRQHQPTCWVLESSNMFRSQKALRTILLIEISSNNSSNSSLFLLHNWSRYSHI